MKVDDNVKKMDAGEEKRNINKKISDERKTKTERWKE